MRDFFLDIQHDLRLLELAFQLPILSLHLPQLTIQRIDRLCLSSPSREVPGDNQPEARPSWLYRESQEGRPPESLISGILAYSDVSKGEVRAGMRDQELLRDLQSVSYSDFSPFSKKWVAPQSRRPSAWPLICGHLPALPIRTSPSLLSSS